MKWMKKLKLLSKGGNPKRRFVQNLNCTKNRSLYVWCCRNPWGSISLLLPWFYIERFLARIQRWWWGLKQPTFWPLTCAWFRIMSSHRPASCDHSQLLSIIINDVRCHKSPMIWSPPGAISWLDSAQWSTPLHALKDDNKISPHRPSAFLRN